MCTGRSADCGDRSGVSPGFGMAKELWQLSASELGDGYSTGEFTPVDVFESVFSRIEKVNPSINAFVTIDEQAARRSTEESAKRWQTGSALGPLDGVPISVKDNILVCDLRSTWGSKLYSDYVPQVDELPIARLRAAGVTILGKTNCPEFTLQGYTDNLLFGPTRNPWDLQLTPGGSSGGAVAAVAAGLGPIAIATDGGGSIRRPASHTGLVGLKPSRGRVPRCDGFPVTLLDFESVGPIARAVDDLILAMRVLSTPDPRDPLSAEYRSRPFEVSVPPQTKIKFIRSFGNSPVDPEIACSVEAAARQFAEHGHIVEEGEVPFALEPLNQAWAAIGQAGLAWLLESFPGWEGKVTPAMEEMAKNGQKRTGSEYVGALDAVRNLRTTLALFFRDYDVILTPSAAALPWSATDPFPTEIAGEKVGPRGHAVFTGFANMAGCPGISVPAAPSARGLPIGFQLVAAPGQDGWLCALAGQYETWQPWAGRFPDAPKG
jgi:aspartyl-tRNA(Asn)/glutamyl-tRNA(Gln) amidotransferase subunit A